MSIDVSKQIPLLQSIPNGGWPLAAQGIPGLISGDAIVQANITNIQNEINATNQFALNNYYGQLTIWKQNNARGIYNPAPDAVTLAGVIPSAMAHFINTGIADPQPIYYYTQFDPAVPPGTILTPPSTNSNPTVVQSLGIGELVPGTTNMYQVIGSPTANEIGETAMFNGGEYMLVPESPFNTNVCFWLKK